MNRWTIVSAVAALGAILLLDLAGTGMSTVLPYATDVRLMVPTSVVIALSAATGGALALGFILRRPEAAQSGTPNKPRRLRDLGYAPLLSILCAAAALLLFAAVQRREIAPHEGALAFVFMVLTLAAGIRCIDLLGKGSSLGFESRWGGLGGGAGGWRILPPTGLAFLAICFAAAALALVTAGSSASNDTTNEVSKNTDAQIGNNSAASARPNENGAASPANSGQAGAGQKRNAADPAPANGIQ